MANGHGPGARFAEVQKAENIGKTAKRLIKYLANEKKTLLLLVFLIITVTLCGVFSPKVMSKAIDILASGDYSNLLKTVIVMSLLFALNGFLSLFQSLICGKLGIRVVKRIREDLFSKLIDLPVRYLDTHSHGDVMSRMTNDVDNMESVFQQILPSLLSGVLTIAGTVIMMIMLCWQLALLSFSTVILTVISTALLAKGIRKYTRERQRLLGKVNGTVEEMVSGYRTVVAFNHQDTIIKEFNQTSDEMTKAGIKAESLSGIMGPVMNCISNIGFVIIAAFGGYFAFNNIITVGVVSAFIVYVKQFSRPINEIAQLYGQLQSAIAGAERVFKIMDEQNEVIEGKKLNCPESATVEFKNINFGYEEGKQVIKDFSLTVPSGKKVALVGATGSGKTTIVNLLMRFYDPDSGSILINDQDITEVSKKSLRSDVSIVLQDAVLFTDTVKNNLKFASKNASDKVVDNAVKMSHTEKLIDCLPDKIDTVLTGAGANISQGQRQLLTIARAFVADPKILILDEATSNVDTRTEKAIQNAMQKIMENRTSIVIAHRLSTIRDADLIVVMDHGRIVETGNHDQLLQQKGKYYDLYMTQFKGIAT